jgi:hypothetical protein
MQTLEPILAQHPFFQDLDLAYRELIVGCAGNVRFRTGEFLFHEGDAAVPPQVRRVLVLRCRLALWTERL